MKYNQIMSELLIKIIADKFNDYFTNIGPNLANKIPSLKGDVTVYIKSNYPNSLFVTSTDVKKIENSSIAKTN